MDGNAFFLHTINFYSHNVTTFAGIYFIFVISVTNLVMFIYKIFIIQNMYKIKSAISVNVLMKNNGNFGQLIYAITLLSDIAH